MEIDIREEEKKLLDEYKDKLKKLKFIEKEHEAVGQVFTKGLLPLYTLFVLDLEPCCGNDISKKIGERTNNLWTPSTGGIYPILKKYEKEGIIVGTWNEGKKKISKKYALTDKGKIELKNKKDLLNDGIDNALTIFKIIYKDLYEVK